MPVSQSLIPEVFEGFNKALRGMLAAAGVTTLTIQQPSGPDGQKIPGARVYWLDHGRPNGSEMVATVQIDIWTLDNMAQALRTAEAINTSFGILPNGGANGTVEIGLTNGAKMSVRIVPIEQGWLNLGDVKPSVTHLAITLTLRWAPQGPAL